MSFHITPDQILHVAYATGLVGIVCSLLIARFGSHDNIRWGLLVVVVAYLTMANVWFYQDAFVVWSSWGWIPMAAVGILAVVGTIVAARPG
ncbi:hypothetical protein [Burkholderia sp. Ac-20365]|uniref:hypothetical protein n=1 Tax=Burkholderia sp. Ac-20365 TaxID=2703897 RepID=UPI00197B8726|nr:hypothetical protein [Burkholderia sp. Ac-20365]MBN3761279.1 hypothetical protein [Burkholderia sp. Ac-20365]